MEGTSESECGAPPSLPSTSPDAFMDVETSASLVSDMLGPPDLDPFNYGSREMLSEWPDDVFSIQNKSPADVGPQSTGENNSTFPARSEAAASAEPQSCRNPQGLCIGLATGLLKSMHVSSPSCLLDLGSQDREPQMPRAVDSILVTNQGALRTVRGFLKCPCYASPQLQLLVTVICTETTAWYWRIIDTYSRQANTNMDTSILPPNRVETLRKSFSIGDHRLEGHLETTLIGQVLSCKLQELDDLIEEITWNTGQSEPKICPMTGEAHIRMAGAVHLRMNAFLGTQLSAVRRGLLNLQDETLRGGVLPPGAHN
ncbi:hypothetical protein PT974_08044 [Cladobotryum mycophilum]|uniref:Aflatoxin regulatory protein domain-containing protein n=1 Tax=Cladobotryum mycophilum TaxID=491253 RepID=A0ABR0SC71_9HYPO